MPALFIGRGNPMNTLEANGYTDAWRAFGRTLLCPEPILAATASPDHVHCERQGRREPGVFVDEDAGGTIIR